MRSLLGEVDGQGLVEYALILILVAIVVIAIVMLLGPELQNTLHNVISGPTATPVVK